MCREMTCFKSIYQPALSIPESTHCNVHCNFAVSPASLVIPPLHTERLQRADEDLLRTHKSVRAPTKGIRASAEPLLASTEPLRASTASFCAGTEPFGDGDKRFSDRRCSHGPPGRVAPTARRRAAWLQWPPNFLQPPASITFSTCFAPIKRPRIAVA